ncbi:adenylate kinase [Thermoflexus sp.]|uniref:adenylate kinase n=1 Tax=Thermoflexus sp. TaxID=1969742 RepID=UPI002ADE90DA|nr:adenylate kinase [Thermoflexus sp.]
MPLDLILLGPPGAGKGTQAKILSQRLGIPHVASGDLFRDHLYRQSPLGQLARQYMDRGELVPDEVTIGMIQERLEQEDCRNGVILDGFPRTPAQARALDGLLAGMGRSITAVLYIRVRDELLLRRLAGRWTCRMCGAVYHVEFNPPRVPGRCDLDGGPLYQREDDTEEVQRRRIQVYQEQTAPLVSFYRERGLLVEIEGERPISEVTEALIRAIELRRAVDP